MEILDYHTLRKERFDKISFPEHLYTLKRSKRGLELGNDKKITSWDLEVLTHEGKTIPCVLGWCTIDENNKVIENDGMIKDHYYNLKQSVKRRKDLYKLGLEGDREGILRSFLYEMSKNKYRDHINFFYNIRYDMSVLLSLLPDKNIQEVYDTNETEFDNLTISIIPGKMMFLRQKYISPSTGKKTTRTTCFYDLAVLTKQSLENACKSWGLEEGKLQLFDTGEVMNDFNLFLIYYNNGDLLKYCKRDVERTCRLAFEVRKHFNSINVPFSRPASPASLSKDYIVYNNKHFPKFSYFNLQKECYKSYYGGLFEFYKRGYFKKARGYDVDSLYPSVMVDLPSLEDCNIRFAKKVDKKADWAIIKAKVWLDPEGKIMPFSAKAKVRYYDYKGYQKISEKILRPVFRGQETTMTKQMYDFLVNEYPYLEKIEVLKVYNIYERTECRKPFAYLKDLFETRVKLIKEHGKDDKRQEVIKIILNSAYGATAEIINKPDYEKLESGEIRVLGRKHVPGQFFRPFLAMHITELSRLKMYQNIFRSDIEQNVIGVATDCIYIEKEGQEKFEKYGDITDKKELGTFSIDYEGDMLAIGNGVYFFDTGEKLKKTTRGFNEKRVPDLYNSTDYDDMLKIPVINHRPLGFREVLYFHSGNKDIIGRFDDQMKELDVNMDRGREWERSVKNLGELKNIQIDSKPIVLEEKNNITKKIEEKIKEELEFMKNLVMKADKMYSYSFFDNENQRNVYRVPSEFPEFFKDLGLSGENGRKRIVNAIEKEKGNLYLQLKDIAHYRLQEYRDQGVPPDEEYIKLLKEKDNLLENTS